MRPIPSTRPRRVQRWSRRAAHGGELRQSPNRPTTDRIQSRRRRSGPVPRVHLFASASAGGVAESSPSVVQVDADALCRVQWLVGRDCGAAAARRRRGRPERSRVTLRCVAQPHRTRNSPARAGRRRGNSRNGIGSSRRTRRGRGRCTPPAASDPPSPSNTCTVTGAFAARLVVHRCTRESKCTAHRARAVAADQSALVHVVLCRAQRGRDRLMAHANARNNATKCEFAFPPTQPTVGFGVTGRAAPSGEGRGASPVMGSVFCFISFFKWRVCVCVGGGGHPCCLSRVACCGLQVTWRYLARTE